MLPEIKSIRRGPKTPHPLRASRQKLRGDRRPDYGYATEFLPKVIVIVYLFRRFLWRRGGDECEVIVQSISKKRCRYNDTISSYLTRLERFLLFAVFNVVKISTCISDTHFYSAWHYTLSTRLLVVNFPPHLPQSLAQSCRSFQCSVSTVRIDNSV
jgi:hypothetical protein